MPDGAEMADKAAQPLSKGGNRNLILGPSGHKAWKRKD